MSNEKENYDSPIEDHEYDGIQEFNYPAPFWWQLFFYISIAFGFGYYVFYEMGGGISSDERIRQAMAEIKRIQYQNKPQGPDVKAILALVQDPEGLRSGKEVYLAKCASCHAPDGGGLVGPNLTDRFWIHGKGEVQDLYQVVFNGVLDKGMPAWGILMSTSEMNAVLAYIKSVQGTQPKTPKSPQGTEVK